MADPMRIRAALAGDETTVRVLMSHPMEPGTRKDAAGALIPAHFIKDIEATSNGKSVLKAMFSGSGVQVPAPRFTRRTLRFHPMISPPYAATAAVLALAAQDRMRSRPVQSAST